MRSYLFKIFYENFPFKIFISFTILIFIISTSFTWFFIHQKSTFLKHSLINDGEVLSKILAQNSRIGVFSENEALLTAPVNGIFQKNEVSEVSIYNLDQRLLKERKRPRLYDSKNQINRYNINRQDIFKRLRTSKEQIYYENPDTYEFWSPIISSSGYNEEFLYFESNNLNPRDRIIGFARICFEKSLLNQQIADLLLKSIFMGILFLLIGASLTFLLVEGITRPLNRLTNGVIALGKGGYVAKVPVETSDEIGKLAQAFNNMTDSLKRREREKNQLEEQLRIAQKMEALGTLAGGIAHDFNNILAIILGYQELVLLDLKKGTALHGYLKEALVACNRARELVKQILTFSRKNKQELRPLQISLIIKEALKMLRSSLPANIDILQEIEKDLPNVLADPTQIHQVMMNLCTNAAQAMTKDEGGVLTVILRMEKNCDKKYAKENNNANNPGGYIRLTVKDTGYGMAPEIMDRIFDPYFTTKKQNEGTGLGLAVTHGIITSCGGMIFVDSVVGEGACFDIYLPAVSDTLPATKEEDSFLLTGKGRILLIDDEISIVEIGKGLLEKLGYEISASTSSIDALAIFQKDPGYFDLVISDIMMPDMTGEMLARKLIEIRSDIPVILCTGFSDNMTEEKAQKMGITALVMKPLMAGELARVVQKGMEKTTLAV